MRSQTYLGVALLAGIIIGVGREDRDARVWAQSGDPCAAALTATATAHDADDPSAQDPKRSPLDHDDRWSHLDDLWNHRAAVAQQRVRPLAVSPQSSLDVGDVAVLQDVGDLIMSPNLFDLKDVGLRLTPNGRGGYDLARTDYGFRQPLGAALALGDDDTQSVALPFAFVFFGRTYDQVFVNSDGNLTFTQGDVSSADRSVSRFLTGPPRVAPLFSDLDPSTGGRVLAARDGDKFSLTWCGVREYGSPRTATVQVTLLSTGGIDIQVSSRTSVREAVVGISPGNTADFMPVDLTRSEPTEGRSAAIGERFTSTSDLDTVAVAQRFLATHPDEFDNLVVFTDSKLLTEAFAYEITVANGIRGLGLAVFDVSAEFGSRGRLQSLCNMDALFKYPDDPRAQFLGENSTLTVLAQEIGHRWLAFLRFRDRAGRASTALLGRDSSHWSFFFDSDASVLEGNDIEDLGGGAFKTVAAVLRYSLLDQYAMGLVDRVQVPPFFYVEHPTNVQPPRAPDSSPEVGVTFNGTRRDVTMDDVIAVMGSREPTAAESPRVLRQAFVYVVSSGRTAEEEATEKVDRIRVAWDQFVSAATDSRLRAETGLLTSARRAFTSP